MSDEEKDNLRRIEDKLEDHSELLTEIRIAVDRLTHQPVCKSPNLCIELQGVLKDHEIRIARMEAIRNWALGVVGTISLIAWICWDLLKLWFKK
jgi:hypothetical protein